MRDLARLRLSATLRIRRLSVRIRRMLPSQQVHRNHAPPPITAQAGAPVPILVAGCHRSGTSLLRRVLDSHPSIACPAETLFLEHFGAAVGTKFSGRGLQSIGLSTADVAGDLGALAHTYLAGYAAGKGKRRWAEKSPLILRQLAGVDALFAGRAQYVCIVRDGMDVAFSLGGAEPRWEVLEPYIDRLGDPFLAAADYWRAMNENLFAFMNSHPDRTHLLRYEDLTQRPERVLRDVCTFLHEPWDPAILEFNRSHHDSGLEDHWVSGTHRFESNSGKHRQLPAKLQARLWPIIRQTMLKFGYQDRHYHSA